MKHIIFFITTIFIVAMSIVSIRQLFYPRAAIDKNKLQVVTTVYPLYYFAQKIGGEKIDVVNITPNGAEPHEYEPTIQDISLIEQSDVFIMNGGGFDTWAEKIKKELNNTSLYVLTASDNLMVEHDPHIWLDPLLAEKEADKVVATFSARDPKEKDYYQKNATKLKEMLRSLDDEFKDALSDCRKKHIVTSHAAFGYIARRYNFVQIPIAGLSPDEEPSPKKLAEIAKFAKTNDVKTIFFETLVSPRLAETIAGEIGAQTAVLHPLEGISIAEQQGGKDFFSIQRENIKELAQALLCQ